MVVLGDKGAGGRNGYDKAPTSSLVQRLADIEARPAWLRAWQTREEESYSRTKALLEADPVISEAPTWLKDHRHADANLWWLQDQTERHEIRREMCRAALRAKG